MRSLALCVTFEGIIPTRVMAGFQSTLGQPMTHPIPTPLTGTQAQTIWVDARPGIYTLLWEWD